VCFGNSAKGKLRRPNNIVSVSPTKRRKNLLAHGARLDGAALVIPQQKVRTQPLEYFDINDYGKLWNPDQRLEGASRVGVGPGAILVPAC
jgi:hypothetical protein